MPRSQAYCGRRSGHSGKCVTAEAYASHSDNRPRKTERRRGKKTLQTPEAKARSNKAQKFAMLGITEEQFDRMLNEQCYACAICRRPFGDKRVCIDHDHAHCPGPVNGHTRACGDCVRGLLCVRCNIWLGWMEKHGEAARAYLALG